MKGRSLKLLSKVLAATMVLSAVSIGERPAPLTYAATAEQSDSSEVSGQETSGQNSNTKEYDQSGKCGDHATYTYDYETKKLTISGKGAVTVTAYSKVHDMKTHTFRDEIEHPIKEVVIGKGITKLEKELFQDCSDLKKVTLPSTLKSIGQECFFVCEKLSSVNFPKKLKTIGGLAFQATSLKKVSLPDSVTEVGRSAFCLNDKLKSVRFSKNIKILGEDVLLGCEKLSKVTLPAKLTRIDTKAFSGCTSLKKIKLPNTLKMVGEGAFSNCRRIKELTIPGGVKTFSDSALSENYGLRKVVNRSALKINLSQAEPGATWKVGKKKVNAVRAGETARAIAKTFHITYKLNGGKLAGKKVSSYTWGEKKVKLPAAKKDGYVFIGWKNIEGNFPDEVSDDPYFARELNYPMKNYALYAWYAKVSAEVSGDDLKIQLSTKRELPDKHFYLIEYADNKEMKNAGWTYSDDMNADGERITHRTDGDQDSVYIHGLEKGKTYYLKCYLGYDGDPDYDEEDLYDTYFESTMKEDPERVSLQTFYETEVTL